MTKAQEFLHKVLASIPREPITITPTPVEDSNVRVGDFYVMEGSVFILAQVDARLCKLIGLDGGNRWNEGTIVKDIFHITPQEFERITSRRQVEQLIVT